MQVIQVFKLEDRLSQPLKDQILRHQHVNGGDGDHPEIGRRKKARQLKKNEKGDALPAHAFQRGPGGSLQCTMTEADHSVGGGASAREMPRARSNLSATFSILKFSSA